MKHIVLLVLMVTAGIAAPIDFTTGINTGVVLNAGSLGLKDGMEVGLPVQTWILNKTYTAQIVPTGSPDDINQSYKQFSLEKDIGFGSARTDGRGAHEVGVESNTFGRGANAAVARWYTTIKNNTENDIDFDFFYEIPEGSVHILGTRFPFQAAHARVEATIDYLLRTPDEDDPGTYIDTTGQLFRYFVDITNEGPDGTLDKSANASVLDLSTSRILFYVIDPHSGVADLPTIPGFGELTVYYDMLALFSSVGNENNGGAFIGDPTQLVQRGGVSFIPANPVPEPATFALCRLAILALPLLRRRTARGHDLR